MLPLRSAQRVSRGEIMHNTESVIPEVAPGRRWWLPIFRALAHLLGLGRARDQRPVDGSGVIVSNDDEFGDPSRVHALLASIESKPESTPRELLAAPAVMSEVTVPEVVALPDASHTPPDADLDMPAVQENASRSLVRPAAAAPRARVPAFRYVPRRLAFEMPRFRRSRFRFLDALLLLAIVGGLSMSRGEPAASSPDVAAVSQDIRRDPADGAEIDSTAQPGVTTISTEGNQPVDEATSPPGTRAAEPETGVSEARDILTTTTTEPKAEKASAEPARESSNRDVDANRAPAKVAGIPAEQKKEAKAKVEPAGRQRLVRLASTAPAEKPKLLGQLRGDVDYRNWRSSAADVTPSWGGPPPVIYGPAPAPNVAVAEPANATKRQDRLSYARSGVLERVMDAPGAVLSGGRQALSNILDAIW
ncbi:hypothetical protein NLM31_20890 [Bradyrhizobium sp. CCGUVB4N]|uniref:hypothetical protein n=1 Tax=Bradyrhizobium sp. CCGUVB4N TaxID=2949631 RepID=UPI0020B4469F|nr:hypothetical protein [Bradyrhizobium sp. CCGUVB4N]MCP3382826.1 hypothetical protein [Bradyrhizobium sp. CCGUVB4N]